MIKNVIFDCGRVIMQYDEHYIASFYAEREEDIHTLATVAMHRKYWNAFDDGVLTEEVYLREVKRELPEHLHAAAAELCKGWTSHMPPVPGMERVVSLVKENGKKLYLLSNFNQRLRNELHYAPALMLFDGLVISGEIRMSKPEEGIYRYLLETYGLLPGECIFIDDRQDNLDTAEKLGMHTYLFDGDADKLCKYLRENGIIA